MKFTQPLKKNYQFASVYKTGASVANKYLVLYSLPSHSASNFLGITVSKKVGKSVVRSRVTRLIKENYRLNEDKIKTGYIFVIIARVSASQASFFDIQKSFFDLMNKQNLLKEQEPPGKGALPC